MKNTKEKLKNQSKVVKSSFQHLQAVTSQNIPDLQERCL